MFDGDETVHYDRDRDSDACDKFVRSRRTSYGSGNGMLSPRDIPRVSTQRSPVYRDVSPHPMGSPTNNNVNKLTPPDQGHFVYPPTPEVSPRYPYGSSHSSTNQLSPLSQSMNSYNQMHSSSMGSDNAPMATNYEVPRGYTAIERYSNHDSGTFLSPRSKGTVGNTSYAMSSTSSNMPYEYHRSFSPMVVDHVKHYSQYPLPERNYPSGYMFSPSVMTGSNSVYPLQSSTSTTNERYYPDVLEEFVDMQAAMHHGIPSRPARGDYGYTPAILTN